MKSYIYINRHKVKVNKEENKDEAVQSIHEYYTGYAVRKNNLSLDFVINEEGYVDPPMET